MTAPQLHGGRDGDSVSDEQIEEVLLDRPIGSVKDLQYTYGALYALARFGPDVRKWAYTPSELDNLSDSDSVIAPEFTVEDGEASYDGLHVEGYAPDMEDKIGLAVDQSDSGQAADASITQKGSDRGKYPDDMGFYLTKMLSRWPGYDVIQEVAADSPDGDLIMALDSVSKDVVDEIGSDIEEALPSDEKKVMVTTVRIRRAGDDEYQWAGGMDVFREAMFEFKKQKMKERNDVVSKGEGVGYITGEEGEVVGKCPSPLDFFLTKQLAKFPQQNGELSWQTYPVTVETALAVDKSSVILDLLRVWQHGSGSSVLYMPYFRGTMGASEARKLFGVFRQALAEDMDDPAEYVMERLYEQYNSIDTAGSDGSEEERLMIWFLSNKRDASKNDVSFEENMGSVHAVADVSNALKTAASRIIEEYPPFDPDNNHIADDDRLFNPELGGSLFRELVYGTVFSFTMREDRSSDNDKPAWDGVQSLQQQLVSNTGEMPVERVISGFADSLTDEKESFPETMVARQYQVLTALADTEKLRCKSDSYRRLTEPPKYMGSDTTSTRDRSAFDRFIEDHPYLAENAEARGAFATGALAGHLSRIQVAKGRSTLMIDRHPVDSIRPVTFQRRATEIMEKNFIYSAEETRYHPQFREIGNEITDALSRKPPNEWSLDTNQLQFFYALGVQFGWGNRISDDDDDVDEDDVEQADN